MPAPRARGRASVRKAESGPVRRRLLVVAALIERRGRVLLSRRRSDQSFPLAWEFPGGKVEPGETPQVALAREISEELGCSVRVGEVAETIRHAYPDFDLVMPVYRATIATGAPRAVTVAEIAWVPRAEILSLPMPPADIPFALALSRTRGRRPARGRAARSSRRSSTPVRRS
jgi:8-oxo-dGTP diphosphatase